MHVHTLTFNRTGKKEVHSANFFSSQNDDAARQREILAEESLEMLISWLHEGGNVAIHDATNSTRARRYVFSSSIPTGDNDT